MDDVDVLGRGHHAVHAQEPEALVDDLEDPLGDPRLPVAVARLTRGQRDDVEQLEHEVGVLQFLGALDVVLGRQLAQLVDRLRLEVGEVQAVLVGIGREGTGEDGGVLPRRVIVAAALAEPALVPALTARGIVGAASRSATLLLRPCVVVHVRLASQRCFIGGSDLDVLGVHRPARPEVRRQDRSWKGTTSGRTRPTVGQ